MVTIIIITVIVSPARCLGRHSLCLSLSGDDDRALCSFVDSWRVFSWSENLRPEAWRVTDRPVPRPRVRNRSTQFHPSYISTE